MHEKLREIEPDIWIKYVTRKIETLPKDADIVIDDLRHRKIFGLSCRAPRSIKRRRLPYDVLLENEGTVEDLYHKLDALIKLLIAQKHSKA